MNAGCSPAPCSDGKCITFDGRQSDQDLAEYSIWHSDYGETAAPPFVVWVIRGDCDDGSIQTDIGCRHGLYRGQMDSIWALTNAYGDNSQYTLWWIYAHELMHAHLDRQTGNADPNHTRPEWQHIDDEVAPNSTFCKLGQFDWCFYR